MLLLSLCFLVFARPGSVASEKRIVRPGVDGVQVPLAALKPSATFKLGGSPDWMVITDEAVWVSNARLKAVHRIDPATNKVVAKINFPAPPCSGLTFNFGSLWVPLCGKPSSLARVDAQTNEITATLSIGPADSEGGITSSDDSIWIVTDKKGTLNRIDAAKNMARQKISISPGSYNPLFSDGAIWVTGFDSNFRNVAVLCTAQQIAFPMARNRSVFHFRGPFANRDGIDDLTP